MAMVMVHLGSEVSHGMVGMLRVLSYTLSSAKYWRSKSTMASLEPSLLASAMASSLSYSVACHCRYQEGGERYPIFYRN